MDVALDAVPGRLHLPATPSGDALVLTHGAGSDADAPLLVTLAGAFAAAGTTVFRYDLPFRQARRRGPPSPAMAPKDRDGLAAAVEAMRTRVRGPVFLGGHSYGGRQASMLAADRPRLVDALLLLSYPLHPPGRATQLRTAHFPALTTSALFVQGTRDPFGSLDEIRAALALIPAPTRLLAVEGAGHDLARGGSDLAAAVVAALGALVAPAGPP